MSIRKTDRDVANETIALEMTTALRGTRVSVTGGGRKGPFTVVVERLGRRQAAKVVKAALFVLGEATDPSPAGPAEA
jgi:hypothetical protein